MEESAEEAIKREEILRIYNSSKEALKIIDDVLRDKMDLTSSNTLIKLNQTDQTPPQIARKPPARIFPSEQIPPRNVANILPLSQYPNRLSPNNQQPARVLPHQPPIIPKRPSTNTNGTTNGSVRSQFNK